MVWADWETWAFGNETSRCIYLQKGWQMEAIYCTVKERQGLQRCDGDCLTIWWSWTCRGVAGLFHRTGASLGLILLISYGYNFWFICWMWSNYYIEIVAGEEGMLCVMPVRLLWFDQTWCCSWTFLDEQHDRLCLPISLAGVFFFFASVVLL